MHNFYVSTSRIIFFLILVGITSFAAHSFHSTGVSVPVPSLPLPTYEENEISRAEKSWTTIPIQTNGADRKYGNIISMQVYLDGSDFSKQEWWAERIEELLKTGKDANIYDRKTIIIFPEHIGTGLVFLGQKERVFHSPDWKTAIDTFAIQHEAELVPHLEFSKKAQPKWEAAFRYQSQLMADTYQLTFARLAKEYSVPILAGSIILPSPKIVGGKLIVDPKGPLYNVSVSFSADGRVMDPLVRKTLLTEEEEMILEPGDVAQDRTWVVPGWKVAVFLGHEVFNSALYERLKGRPLDGLVSPAFSFPKLNIEKMKNYINDPEIGSLSENEIWIKHGLSKHIKITRAVESVQVFLHGKFFEEGTSGKTFNIRDFVNKDESESESQPRILNLYF
ncbi:carbon-nitrogen hydrolase [Leptospira kobayashii]|uniref:Carbon-nitrogen hydrolase n=1 Tax=Leptospira kobayashii TaxID=1917830 RepID=A0ABM7UN23_9LEPT|nr:hydrolase, carbon-nitrogen family protein [Leptospira kobayashii]BDA80500.1 carbon-nitrogen hydrolase [Leptospira kobayashii]